MAAIYQIASPAESRYRSGMPEPLTRRFARFPFVVDVEADPADPCLVTPGNDPADVACSRVLADEISSGLNSLDGIASVTVEQMEPPTQ